ncbi:hypothetical protein X551_02486 [Methylibium sp. T29]|nr:hypothetical protein X551_02486 [Methylibium sp. T29]
MADALQFVERRDGSSERPRASCMREMAMWAAAMKSSVTDSEISRWKRCASDSSVARSLASYSANMWQAASAAPATEVSSGASCAFSSRRCASASCSRPCTSRLLPVMAAV